MTHPTDEELEARAAKLDRKTHNMTEAHVQMEYAADLLRACKTRGAPVAWRWRWNGGDEPDVWSYSETEIFTDTHRIVEPLFADLEPAPDHAEWNAAIEAAVKVSEEMSNTREAEQTAFIDDTAIQEADFGNDIAFAIRQLKKGNTHENT